MRHFTLIAATVLLVGVSWAIAQNLENSPAAVNAVNSLAKANSLNEISKMNSQTKLLSQAPKQRVEIGLVHWGRDLVSAQKQSAESGKPILLLFQEVPG